VYDVDVGICSKHVVRTCSMLLHNTHLSANSSSHARKTRQPTVFSRAIDAVVSTKVGLLPVGLKRAVPLALGSGKAASPFIDTSENLEGLAALQVEGAAFAESFAVDFDASLVGVLGRLAGAYLKFLG
jgi:hypothetical protein